MMKQLLLLLCLINLPINLLAESQYIDFNDLTKNQKSIVKKRKHPHLERFNNAFSYSLNIITSPSDLFLSAQPVHRITYHNIEKQAYVFFSRGQGSNLKNAGIWEVSINTDSASDSVFKTIQLGGGFTFFPFHPPSLKRSLAGTIEVAIQSYNGENSDLSYRGYFISFGLEYTKQLSKKLQLTPSAGLRFEHLGTAHIGNNAGRLESPISGIASQVGIQVRYIF